MQKDIISYIYFFMQPITSPLSAAAVATSSGITERAASAVAIAGMVC